MREKRVVVALVQDGRGRFLVHFNPRWGGYTFPMKDLGVGADVLGSAAIQALEDDLGCKLPGAEARELEYLGRFGRSGRTGDETPYEYWLYAVEPGQALDLSAAPTWNNNPPAWLAFDELVGRNDLTWSAAAIVRELVEDQEAVLAVVPRPGQAETEFLVVWNDNYGGYFFPTQRVKTEAKPDQAAVMTVRSDLAYRGPAAAFWRGEVSDVHFSNRFQRDRRFRFHVCEVQLPELDLHQPCGVLEQALTRRHKRFVWLPAGRLADPAVPFSPTMAAVRATVLNVVPLQTLAQPLRRSEGGLALLERTSDAGPQWLARWNEHWRAFFFVGGHRKEGETFRECVAREVQEELGIAGPEVTLGLQPALHLEYRARSLASGELTAYTTELFEAQPSSEALSRVARDPRNRWLSAQEIRRLEASDARTVSVTMLMMLSGAGRIS